MARLTRREIRSESGAVWRGVRLRLDGTFNDVVLAGEAAREFCAEQGLTSNMSYRLELVLEELLRNVIEHGGAEAVASGMDVEMTASEGEVLLVVVDRGPVFNPWEAPEPDLSSSLEARTVGGLGIHLARHYADECGWERRRNTNVVSVRFRPPAPNASSE